MKLHEDKNLFREAIEAAAQHLKLRPVFIEKDYWVTYVLRNLGINCFADPQPNNLVPISSYIAEFFARTGNGQLIAFDEQHPADTY